MIQSQNVNHNVLILKAPKQLLEYGRHLLRASYMFLPLKLHNFLIVYAVPVNLLAAHRPAIW